MVSFIGCMSRLMIYNYFRLESRVFIITYFFWKDSLRQNRLADDIRYIRGNFSKS